MVLTGKSCLLIFLGLAAFVGLLLYLWPRPDEPSSGATLKVLGHGWKRTLQVEEYAAVNDTAWEGELPKGAVVISQGMEIRRKHIVRERRPLKGATIVDDFYDEKNQLRYHYKITRWNAGAVLSQQGEDLHPVWPAFKPSSPTEREGKRTEEYFLRLQDQQSNRYVFKPRAEAEWRGFADGSSYPATLSGSAVKALGKI